MENIEQTISNFKSIEEINDLKESIQKQLKQVRNTKRKINKIIDEANASLEESEKQEQKHLNDLERLNELGLQFNSLIKPSGKA